MDKEPRYIVEVEHSVAPYSSASGYNVICDDDIDYLIVKVKEAMTRKFDSYLGSCPELKVLKVSDSYKKLNSNELTKYFIKNLESADSIFSQLRCLVTTNESATQE